VLLFARQPFVAPPFAFSLFEAFPRSLWQPFPVAVFQLVASGIQIAAAFLRFVAVFLPAA